MIRLFNVVLALKTGIMRGNFASLTHHRWALIHHMVCPCLAMYIIISLGILIRVICPWTNTASLLTVVIHTEDACTASHIPTYTAWVLIIHKKPGMVDYQFSPIKLRENISVENCLIERNNNWPVKLTGPLQT
jgi:hypothetical protein